jgi:hypothetical protein
MSTVIFVHGISVRQDKYKSTLDRIRLEISGRKRDEKVNVVGCLWGDLYGAKLNAGGISNNEKIERSAETDKKYRWDKLYEDPTYEVKLLLLQIPQKESQSPLFVPAIRTLVVNKSDELKKIIYDDFGIPEDVFESACNQIFMDESVSTLTKIVLKSLREEFYVTIARSIIASLVVACEWTKYSVSEPMRRDSLVQKILDHLRDRADRGFFDKLLSTDSVRIATSPFVRNIEKGIGKISDLVTPNIFESGQLLAGDILIYQRKGHTIRDFIHEIIRGCVPPVTLLTHSLGGVACFELLIENKNNICESVKTLITVGSQAPFFYEIDALSSLPFGSDLSQYFPENFPKWINVYDESDLLSYVGKDLFPNRVFDLKVDNNHPSFSAHSGYWDSVDFWNKIIGEI